MDDGGKPHRSVHLEPSTSRLLKGRLVFLGRLAAKLTNDVTGVINSG